MCRIDLDILPQIRCKCKCFLKKVDFLLQVLALPLGELDAKRPERAYNAFRMMSYSTGFIRSMSSGLPSRMLE